MVAVLLLLTAGSAQIDVPARGWRRWGVEYEQLGVGAEHEPAGQHGELLLGVVHARADEQQQAAASSSKQQHAAASSSKQQQAAASSSKQQQGDPEAEAEFAAVGYV